MVLKRLKIYSFHSTLKTASEVLKGLSLSGCTYVPTYIGSLLLITIFCDFCQFSEKKMAFYSKPKL
jgi:hypothetical protein